MLITYFHRSKMQFFVVYNIEISTGYSQTQPMEIGEFEQHSKLLLG